MPGYEPFLLCDFHVHTQWSDGKLSVSEVVDLYGSTGKFDVIAITDHILMKKDLLARAGRLATLGRRAFGVREQDFAHYLENVRAEAKRALKQYGMLVVPGAEITQNRLRGRKNSHIIALDIQQLHQRRSVSQRHPARDPSSERAEHRVPSAPSHDATDRDQHLLSLGPPRAVVRSGGRLGSRQSGRPVFGDELEALPVRRQQRFPQTEAPLFVEDARARREELAGREPCASRERRHRAHAVPQRVVGGVEHSNSQLQRPTGYRTLGPTSQGYGDVIVVDTRCRYAPWKRGPNHGRTKLHDDRHPRRRARRSVRHRAADARKQSSWRCLVFS